MKNFIGILALSFLGGLSLQAQTSYTLASTSECTIEGTSTLHNWTAKVDDVNGFLVLGKEFSTEKGPKMGAEIEQASLTFKVKSIHSGQGEIMDNNIYDAFDEPNHPLISFALNFGSVRSVDKKGRFILFCKGQVSMAGLSQSINVELIGEKAEDGSYVFTGQHSLRMTDFGMDPPSAMYGSIETGNNVIIKFNLVFKP
jgi:hypothetical protein